MRAERRGAAAILALAACACIFAVGLAGLFRDRLETGDIYPPGSTLRSDPLGARALFEALDRYPGIEATRAYARADLRGAGSGDAVFFLALDARHPPRAVLRQMDTLAGSGARAVAVFRATAADTASPAERAASDSLRTKQVTVTRVIPEEALPAWGFRIRADGGPDSTGKRKAFAVDGGPDSLPWLGAAWFDSLAPEWRVRYRSGGRPVVIERDLGAGSLALASDEYFASNEAQREPLPFRPARLASLLAGNSARIIFDERHLGVRRDDGLADLLIRHRLHWALPSLLLLLGLFLWKSRARGAPAVAETAATDALPDPRSSLAALLRRSLGDRLVLENCVKLWLPADRAAPAADSDPAIRSELAKPLTGTHSLATAYGAIQSILNPRKPK